MTKKLVLLFSFFLIASSTFSNASGDQAAKNFLRIENGFGEIIDYATRGLIKTNLEYSKIMFDRQNDVTNKPLQQLLFRADGKLKNQSLYVGGRFIGTGMYEWTDTDGKFPIISRLPTQDSSGEFGNEYAVNDASLNVTLAPVSWLTGFVQGEYTEVEYPGQDEHQVRKYWVTLGDLSRFPVYATFGRNTVTFGKFDSYAPFTHNHSSHYFWAQSDDPHLEVGFYKDGWHLAGSWIQSDRGLRVLNTPDSDGWKNFALNARKSFEIGKDVSAEVGAGYLHSTIYDSTLAHHPPAWNGGDNERNGAVNVNATLTIGKVDLNVEYTQTINEWPATNHHVSAITAQGRYRHEIFGRNAIASFMFSRGTQGEEGVEWERMSQIVAGYELEVHPNLTVGAEYLNNKGFVPLIMPTFTGDRDVDTHTMILGARATF